MIGFDDIEEARETYLKHYPDPRILGEIRRRPMDSFRMLVRKMRGEEGPKKMASIKCASDHSLILALEADRLGASDDLEKLANVMRAVRAARFPTSVAKSRIPSTTTAASGATAPKTTTPKPLTTQATAPPTPAVQRPVGAPQPPADQAQAAGVPARSPASAPATTASAPAVPTQSVPNPTPTTAPTPSPVGANAGATSAPATAPAVSASAPAVPGYASASEYVNQVNRVRSMGDNEIWENVLKQNPSLRTATATRRADEIAAARRNMMPTAPKNDRDIQRLLAADDPSFANLSPKEKARRVAAWKTEAGLRRASEPIPAQPPTSGATPRQPGQPAQPAGTDPAAPAAGLGIPWGKLVGLTALGTGTYAAYRGIDAAANLAGGAHNFGTYSGPVHPSMNPNAYYSGGPGYL